MKLPLLRAGVEPTVDPNAEAFGKQAQCTNGYEANMK